MGALTSNRKRSGDAFSLSFISPPHSSFDFDSPVDFHVSKKPKLSSMRFNTKQPVSYSQQSTFQRVHQYPEITKPLRREVHGPCRNPKFSRPMGNVNALFGAYKQAKTLAFDTFKYAGKDKPVIDVEEECGKDVISDDSDVEEVQIVDHDKDLTQKSRDTTDDSYPKEKYERIAVNPRQGSSSLISDLSHETPRYDQTPKPVDGGNMLGSPSINHGVEEVCEIPNLESDWEVNELPHRKLHNSAGRRDSRLSQIFFQIEFFTKKSSLFRSAKKPEKFQDLRREPFVKLTNDEEIEVSRAFSNTNRRKLLVTHADSNIEITGEVLQCLRPGAWLNDEVINLYLELLKEREKREPERFLKCHFFNTFFYKKLTSGKGGYDFKAVRRWTTQRKIGYGLMECAKIFVPIHKEIHWCLGIINIKDEKIQYLDSLKGRDPKVLHVLAKYYVDEVKDKSAKDIDISSWELEYVDDLPAQENGFDCGMFMIKYADFYSRGLNLCFGQKDMPYFRKRTAKELLRLKAD